MVISLLLATALQDWPQFRGPDGQGHASVRALPLRWSDGEKIAWRTAVDGLGWSSPAVANGRAWITTATDGGRSLRVQAFDVADGRRLLDVEVARLAAPEKIHPKNSHASPTAVVAGERVYVHFGSYATACLGTDGKVIWRQELRYMPVHGPGGSPALVGDVLVVSCDGGDRQFVAGLDAASGRVRWSTPRTGGTSQKKFAFSTPLVLDGPGRPQVVSPGAGVAGAYEAATGRLLWQVRYDEGYSVIPRPVRGHGLIFLGTGYDRPALLAIREGGSGDVTETHVAWRMERSAPHSASPLLVGDELYVVSDNGVATCLDAKTGAVCWQERVGGRFSASPFFAAGRIYLQDEDGATTVLQPGRIHRVLARNEIKGRTLATPAPLEGALLIRTDKELIKIAGTD